MKKNNLFKPIPVAGFIRASALSVNCEVTIKSLTNDDGIVLGIVPHCTHSMGVTFVDHENAFPSWAESLLERAHVEPPINGASFRHGIYKRRDIRPPILCVNLERHGHSINGEFLAGLKVERPFKLIPLSSQIPAPSGRESSSSSVSRINRGPFPSLFAPSSTHQSP